MSRFGAERAASAGKASILSDSHQSFIELYAPDVYFFRKNWYNTERKEKGECPLFSVRVKSYAKVNLSLNISGVREGWHALDTVVASIDLFDTVRVRARKDKLINVFMRGRGSENIPPERNNAVRAGEAFVETFGTSGADIEIDKDIPMGAGLGGSSADAAGVLNALAKLYKAGDLVRRKALADELGSDTGYMLTGGFARLSGRGTCVQPLASPRRYSMLLFLPDSPVSTAECYRRYDEAPDPLRADSARLASALCAGDFAGVAANVYNALQRPACALNAAVGEALAAAASFSPAACAVTGSGSAVFALFESEELCRWAQSRYRGKMRTRIVHTLVPGEKRGAPSPYALGREGLAAGGPHRRKDGRENA